MYEHLGPQAAMRGLRIEEFECRIALYAPASDDVEVEMFSATSAGSGTADWRSEALQIHERYGLTGAGQIVVVIDSGIAYDHPALGGGFGADARVIAGYDFTEEQDGDPYDDGPVGAHGTHVAGIIASDDPRYPGLAPDVQLIALRVFNDQGLSKFKWIEEALQWVLEHRESFAVPITTVNLSIGMNPDDPVTAKERILDDELSQLVNAGIFVSIAVGNGYDIAPVSDASYPGSHPAVVPVGSVGTNGLISGFSRRTPRMLLAPGEAIYSTAPDYLNGFNYRTDDWYQFSGTSQATPYVSGAAVLVRQALQRAGHRRVTQADVLQWLRSTADWVFDPATQQTYPRVNLRRAIEAILPEPPASADSAFPPNLTQPTDKWGPVDMVDVRTVSIDGGEHWIELRAERDGPLIVQTQFGPQHAVNLGIYDVHGNSIGQEGSSGGDHASIVDVRQGETIYVKLVGPAISGKVLVGQPELTVHDFLRWTISAGISSATVSLNSALQVTMDGFLWDVGHELANSVELSFAASPSLHVTLGPKSSDVYLRSNGVEIMGNATQTRFRGVSTVTLDATRGSADMLRIYGTNANEYFASRDGTDSFRSPEIELVARGFERTYVFGGGGVDIAELHGGQRADLFVAKPEYARLSDAFQLDLVEGFTKVYAYAGSGGMDRAFLYGSGDDDTLAAHPHHVRLATNGRLLFAESFDRVYATAEAGGIDRAFLYGSDGADHFLGQIGFARLAGTGYLHIAEQFDRVYAYGGGGEGDLVELLGSPRDDAIIARLEEFSLGSSDYHLGTYGFDRVHADMGQGGRDRAQWAGADDALNRIYLGLDWVSLVMPDVTWEVLGIDAISIKPGNKAINRGFVTETQLVNLLRTIGYVQPLYVLEASGFVWRSDVRFSTTST
jgi:hypothetical protein